MLEHRWRKFSETEVGLAWADRLKRRGDLRCREIWTALWEQNRSYPALEELLKWLEHRVRSDQARNEALVRIQEAVVAPFLPRLWRENLEKRFNRISGLGLH